MCLSTQRDPDTNLSRALSDRECHDAVEPDCGEQQGREREHVHLEPERARDIAAAGVKKDEPVA